MRTETASSGSCCGAPLSTARVLVCSPGTGSWRTRGPRQSLRRRASNSAPCRMRFRETEMPLYVVTKPESIKGIYETWAECKSKVDGVAGAVYQKVEDRDEAVALLERRSTGSSEGK